VGYAKEQHGRPVEPKDSITAAVAALSSPLRACRQGCGGSVKRSSGIQKQVRRKGTVLASDSRNESNDQRLESEPWRPVGRRQGADRCNPMGWEICRKRRAVPRSCGMTFPDRRIVRRDLRGIATLQPSAPCLVGSRGAQQGADGCICREIQRQRCRNTEQHSRPRKGPPSVARSLSGQQANNRMGIVWIGRNPVAVPSRLQRVGEIRLTHPLPVLRTGPAGEPAAATKRTARTGKPAAKRDPRRLRRQTDIALPTGGEW